MNASMIRNRYVGDSVSTASPARLVTMLYDRLVRDLCTAETALSGRDLAAANSALVHAQEIVWELAAGLDVTKWSGGPALAALYQFVIAELLAANVKKDVERVVSVRSLVEPLRDAWHQAAELAAASGPGTASGGLHAGADGFGTLAAVS
jgi:flagellar secretion chaperone FliS